MKYKHEFGIQKKTGFDGIFKTCIKKYWSEYENRKSNGRKFYTTISVHRCGKYDGFIVNDQLWNLSAFLYKILIICGLSHR